MPGHASASCRIYMGSKELSHQLKVENNSRNKRLRVWHWVTEIEYVSGDCVPSTTKMAAGSCSNSSRTRHCWKVLSEMMLNCPWCSIAGSGWDWRKTMRKRCFWMMWHELEMSWDRVSNWGRNGILLSYGNNSFV